MWTRSQSLGYLLLVAICLTALPVRVEAQQVSAPRSPLELAEIMAAKLEPDSMERSLALGAITGNYWRLKQFKAALRASAAQPPDQEGSAGLFYVDQALERGDRKFADQLLQQLIASDPEADQHFRLQYLRRLVQLDHLEQAEELARQGNAGEWSYSEALLEVTRAYLRIKQLDRTRALVALASAAIEPSPGSESDCSSLSQIIPLFVALGQPEKAEAALQQGLLLADTIHHNPMSSQSMLYEEGDHCRGSLVEAMARIGRFDQALSLVEALDPMNRAAALIKLAEIYRTVEQPAKSVELLDRAMRELDQDGSIGSSFARGDLAKRIIEQYLALNQPVAAAGLAARVEKGDRGDNGYSTKDAALIVAGWYFKAGRRAEGSAVLDDAVKFVSRLKLDQSPRSGVSPGWSPTRTKILFQGELIDAYLEGGNYRGARRAIDTIELPHARAGKMADLAGALIEAGQQREVKSLVDEAQRLIDSPAPAEMDDPVDPASSKIASIYARLGDRSRALDMFVRILDGKRIWELYGDPLIKLAEIGYYFERSSLAVDRRIAVALRAIERDYSNRNLFD